MEQSGETRGTKTKKQDLNVEEVMDELQQMQEQTKPEDDLTEDPSFLNFTSIPLRKVVHGMTGNQLTEANFDRSGILLGILSSLNKPEDFLGELQVAFV